MPHTHASPLALIALGACTSALPPQPSDLDLSEIRHIVVDAYEATIRVGAGDVIKTATHVEWTSRKDRPLLDHSIQGETLFISSACDPHTQGCVLEHTLTVPSHVSLDLFLDSVQVDIQGAIGPLSGEVTNASILMDGTEARVDLIVSNTAVVGTSLRSENMRLTSTGGDVTLDHDLAPMHLDISAHDRVAVALPPAVYDLQLSSQFGQISDPGIEDVDGAEHRITVHTRMGGISITER